MNNLQMQQESYLEYCQFQKRLDFKTLKAYRIDLTHFLARYLLTTYQVSPLLY